MLDFAELGNKDIDASDEEDYGPVLLPVKKKGLGPPKAAVKAAKKVAPIGDRKMEVLILVGRQSNDNLANFQAMGLKSAMGKDVNIRFLEGDVVWQFREDRDLHDVDAMTKSLAKGKDFFNWFDFDVADPRGRVDTFALQDPQVKVTYKDPEKAVDKFLNFIEEKGPVDVVMTLFEGSIVVHLAIAQLMQKGQSIPWRLSVFFGDLPVRDDSYAEPFVNVKFSHPTIHVFGRMDEYTYYARTGAGRKAGEDYYENPLILEHNEGHKLPSVEPRAKEIYERIKTEALYQCGLHKSAPRRVLNPPKPLNLPVLDMELMAPRKLRVLAMCGGHSCIPVIKFQTNGLRNALGDAAEWTYLQGNCDWTWFKGEPTVSEMEEKIANGKQLKNWYMDTPHDDTDRLRRDMQFDPKIWVEYHDVLDAVKYVKDFIIDNGPFDVVVGFSQGVIMLHLLIGFLRREVPRNEKKWQKVLHSSEDMPWRLSLMFNGMHIRDKDYFDLFETKSPHRTVQVFGKDDEYYDYSRDGFGNKPQEEYYESPVVLVHEQNHQFPTEQPRAKQIYDRCVAEIWKYCGPKPQ